MEIGGRRARRFSARRDWRQPLPLLPLRAPPSSHLSNTVSCWYCDLKITALNDMLFRFGRKHAGCLQTWFSIGVGFSLSALFGLSLILLWEITSSLLLGPTSAELAQLSRALFYGFSPSLSSFTISLADVGFMCISTILSLILHELGHAVAAAREGIQIEYIAIFIAVLFPGALVAFNYESLEVLPRLSALRVYCAGIWHNAVCCAACGLTLFLLPLVLFPLYIHGRSPMVLDVPPTSLLSGYLSHGDVIVSVDNIPIQNSLEWIEMTALIYNLKLESVNNSSHPGVFRTANSRKGYCIHRSMMEETKKAELVENKYYCPNDLTAFVNICFGTSMRDDSDNETDGQVKIRSMSCLDAKDVVKLGKCGDGWLAANERSSCICSQDEACLAPVQMPGSVWVEIAYFRPSHDFLPFGGRKCSGTFVFVGDLISMAHSIQLTSYQPRWPMKFFAYIPNVLERLLIWTFHISLALVLLNSLPVYLLDGESILDATLCHFPSLNPTKRKKVLHVCLFGGTFISAIMLFRNLFNFFVIRN